MNSIKVRKEMGLMSAILTGTLISITAAVILCGILSWMLVNGKIPESAMMYCSTAVLILSSVLGAFGACFTAKQRKLLASIGGSLGFLVCMLSCTALFFSGQYSGVGQGALCVLGSGCAVGLVGQRPRNKGYGQVRKRRYR